MNDFLHKLPAFISNHLLLCAAAVALVLALLVTQAMVLFRKYKELTPAGLTLLINRETPLLIDLSTRADFEKAHLPGARHVPMSQFDPEQKDLTAARELPVVLMDKDGRGASHTAAQRLIKAGFTHVNILAGGVLAWREAQLPVAKGLK